jgi:hypothetical protein
MCEDCENCLKVRFIKPEEGGRSFCVTQEEAIGVRENVKKWSQLTTTHQEKTLECDHPDDFEVKQA